MPPVGGPAPEVAAADDVLRIEAEEPVFYIGPDTRPPQQRHSIQERIRANWEALRRPVAYRRPAPAPGPPRQRPRGRAPAAARPGVAGHRAAPAAAPAPAGRGTAAAGTPGPAQRPRAGGRAGRLDALGGPLVALLVLPAAAALGVDIESDPQQLAFLYGLGLMGTWTALIPNKLFETRSLDMSTRRLIALVGGLVVGGAAIVLAQVLQLGLAARSTSSSAIRRNLEPLYFGAMYAATAGWFGLAARDRRKRFRLIPIAWTSPSACFGSVGPC